MTKSALPDFSVTRSRRRTIALRVTVEGKVEVRAPHNTSDYDIEEFLTKHQDWLHKRLRKSKELQEEAPEHKFAEGEIFYYLGRRFRLVFVPGRTDADFEEDRLECRPGPPPFTRKLLLKLYRRDAMQYLTERTLELAEDHGFKLNAIKMSGAARRWGSCNSSGNISFTWRLMMCPPEIIDYVICHELAHLKELNHSSAYWKVVEEICPDYKALRKRLRDEQHLYSGF